MQEEGDYQLILKYMQAVNQDDFEQAKRTMEDYGYNLNAAINGKFNQEPVRNQQRHEDNFQDDMETVRKYGNYLRNKQLNWSLFGYIARSVFGIFKGTTTFILSFLSKCLVSIVPEVILSKILYSPFKKLYSNSFPFYWEDQKVQTALRRTKQNSNKAIFLVISPKEKSNDIVELLRSRDRVEAILNKFIFLGVIQGDKILQKLQQQHDSPSVVIFRHNIYEQIVVLDRIPKDKFDSITPQRIRQLSNQCNNLYKRDKNVLIKYRNYIRRTYYGIHIEQEQEEEVNFIERTQVTEHINQQNQQYKRVEEQARKKKEEEEIVRKKMEQEKKLNQEREELRKIRKMSIPEEPKEGNLVQLTFRCPDGSTITRNFLKNEKVELLYNWTETNDEVEFEDEKAKNFDLMFGFPPTSLEDKKQQLLESVFEESIGKVIIKEV